MIKKINKEAPYGAWALGCGAPKEASNNDEPVTLDELKERVSNYKAVMTRDFNVPDDKILTMVPINAKHLSEFIATNKGLSGARVYLTKKTSNKQVDDFEVLFVPCKLKEEETSPENSYFEDMLGEDCSVVSVMCRRPPGCEKGALLF